MNSYQLHDGVTYARGFQALAQEYGLNIGLTGSCLHIGSSSNDVDLIAYPHKTGKEDVSGFIEALKAQGFSAENRTPHHLDDKKIVWKFTKYNLVVDIMFLQ